MHFTKIEKLIYENDYAIWKLGAIKNNFFTLMRSGKFQKQTL